MFDWSLQSLQDQLLSVEDTTQIIFAHPHYQNQKHVVHCLIHNDDVAYISFTGGNLTLSDLSQQVDNHLQEYEDVTLNYVILDDCDVATPDVFSEFLLQFANDNKQLKIIVNSRVVFHELLEETDFRSRCQFIPVYNDLMLYDYAQRDTSRTLVEVRAFGSGIVHINGRQLEQWDGILPRQLFFYLADRGMSTRNDIFATFWSQLNTREATNVFHVTKRKVTDIMGESFTKFGGGFYRVSPNIDLSYDVVGFSQAIQNSVISSDDDSLKLLENAVTLYRAPFLNAEDDKKETWVGKRREELHEMYGEALSMLAEIKLKNGEEQQALGYYLNALRILNYHEDIVARVMKIYRDNGQTQDALELYDWIEHNLQEDYGIKPNAQLQDMADRIRQKPLTA